MTKVNIDLDTVEDVSKRALIAHGAAPWIAQTVAQAVRTAEAKGNLICGLYYLESYCKQLVTGRVNGDAEPKISKPKGSVVVADAQFGFAQAAFARALPAALDAARENGTAILAVAHAHTCTSLGYFAEQIAQAGLIGIGFTNASAVVSPPGGNKAVLGTNPIAMAIPAQDGGVAFQFDQSTSAIALGKITMAKAAGEPIPLGWAVDADGAPTTDAAAALSGSLVSSGGYKGFGFGLMAEILAAAVTGSVNSVDVAAIKAPEGAPHDLGQFYFLVDPTVASGDQFWSRLDRISQVVGAQEGARLPGSKFTMPTHVDIETNVWDLAQSLKNGPAS